MVKKLNDKLRKQSKQLGKLSPLFVSEVRHFKLTNDTAINNCLATNCRKMVSLSRKLLATKSLLSTV